MKKTYITLTILVLFTTSFKMHAEEFIGARVQDPIANSLTHIADARDIQAKNAYLSTEDLARIKSLATLSSTTGNHKLTDKMSSHDIVAQINAHFSGKLTLQEQSKLASAIDIAQKAQDNNFQNLNTTLTAIAQNHSDQKFNEADFFKNLKTAEKGTSFSDKFSSFTNYIKLKFADAVSYVKPGKEITIDEKGVQIDLATAFKPQDNPSLEPPVTEQTSPTNISSTKTRVSFKPQTLRPELPQRSEYMQNLSSAPQEESAGFALEAQASQAPKIQGIAINATTKISDYLKPIMDFNRNFTNAINSATEENAIASIKNLMGLSEANLSLKELGKKINDLDIAFGKICQQDFKITSSETSKSNEQKIAEAFLKRISANAQNPIPLTNANKDALDSSFHSLFADLKKHLAVIERDLNHGYMPAAPLSAFVALDQAR